MTGIMKSPISTEFRPREEFDGVLVIDSDETGKTISTVTSALPEEDLLGSAKMAFLYRNRAFNFKDKRERLGKKIAHYLVVHR